jgi:hypothetical protein
MCAWPFEICVGLSINTLFSLSIRVKNTFFPFLSKGKITLFLKKIAGMRDLIDHGYDSFDHESIWPILIEFIPESVSICEGILSKSNVEQCPISCCCDMYCNPIH